MNNSPKTRTWPSRHARSREGFTLIELLVVIAIIAILAGILLPALSKSKTKAHGIICLNHTKQLSMAWRMYAEDADDRICYASHRLPMSTAGNAYAWTWTSMDYTDDPKNWDPQADMVKRVLWKYAPDYKIYHCPADTSYVTVRGEKKPRIRSLSMNLFLGGFAGEQLVDEGKPYTLFLKMSDIVGKASPGPSKTWVFLDQREDSINWGNFMTDMKGSRMKPWDKPNEAAYQFGMDMPASYHNGAGGFTFADGHSEIHKWLDPRTKKPIDKGVAWGNMTIPSPRNKDIAFLHNTTTRPKDWPGE